MELHKILSEALAALEQGLFKIGKVTVTPLTLVVALLIVLTAYVLTRLAERLVLRAVGARELSDLGARASALRLLHYLVLFVAIGIALHTLGVNMTGLFAAGAVFAVGFGFAMQNITQNFFSGLILLMERSIKPGDILEVDDRMVRVREMGLRSTVARTLDEEDLIIPNAVLVQQTVKNYTLRDNLVRLRATVGVAYGSDLGVVEETLVRACHGLPGLSPGHPPAVLLTGLGDSAVLFEVSVWIENPWSSRIVLSQLYKEIVAALGRAGVTIAFPQLDVHLPGPPAPTPGSGG